MAGTIWQHALDCLTDLIFKFQLIKVKMVSSCINFVINNQGNLLVRTYVYNKQSRRNIRDNNNEDEPLIVQCNNEKYSTRNMKGGCKQQHTEERVLQHIK